jgi:hypothetical protein
LTQGGLASDAAGMVHELRVTDKQGFPVQLVAGSLVALTVDGSENYQGSVLDSDQGGVTRIDFADEVYAAYRAARDSQRPAGRFRNQEVGG